jgi:hypothetical protein
LNYLWSAVFQNRCRIRFEKTKIVVKYAVKIARKIFMLKKETRRFLILFCLLAISGLSLTSYAQSRRQKRETPAPVEQTPAPVEQKTTQSVDADEPDETPVQIKSLKIVGEIQHDAVLYGGTDFSNAIKEFIRALNSYSKNAPVMTRAGKATYKEAKELAKKESDTFVLWIGFMAKTGSSGNMYLETVQYAVIKPNTGKILTRAEIRPESTRMIRPGVILPAPTVRRSGKLRDEMDDSVRRIAANLARAGWLN